MSCAEMPVSSDSSEEILVPENASSPTATTNQPHLPEEIWCKIFAYLAVQDRNNVRSTCRHFYKACDSPNVQTDEEIILNGNINTNIMVQTWSRAERKLRNLKLNGAYLMDDPILDIFKYQGPFIHSLTLRNCELAPGLLRQIIENCEYLQSIALVGILTQENLFDDFRALECNQIIRANVTNFTYALKRSESFNLTNCKFLRFFVVFPNIRNLELKIRVDAHFNEFSILSSDVTSDAVFSFSCIYDLIWRMRNQLETLTLFFLYFWRDLHFSLQTFNQISRIEMRNLKKMSLNWIDLWDSSIANPFLPFRNLTHLDCMLGSEILIPQTPSNFVLLLLSTATKLQSLIISTFAAVELHKDCFVALMKSQLRSLEVYHQSDTAKEDKSFLLVWLCFEQSSLDPLLIPNRVLKSAQFKLNDRDFSIFTTHFLSLECIVVEQIEKSSLQNILKYQENLKSLSMCNCDQFPEDNYVPKDGAFLRHWLNETPVNRKFDHLCHLEIMEHDRFQLCAFLLDEFEFPKLKSLVVKTMLSLAGFQDDEFEPVLKSMHNLKELEYLQVETSFKIPFAEVLALCCTLPKLRGLILTNQGSEPYNEFEYRQLLQVCPSLIAFVHKDEIKYYKDVITNRILKVPSIDRGFFFKVLKKYRIY